MKERPILFSAPMVRAILAGTKTQTRRIVKPQMVVPTERPLKHPAKHPASYFDAYCSERKTDKNPRGMSDRWCWWTADDRPDPCSEIRCPYGAPGDRLFVKETWQSARDLDAMSPAGIGEKCLDAGYPTPWAPLRYVADGATNGCSLRDFGGTWGKMRVSIHMPRWASRITLEVTGVRVERLQAITEEDARAEGVRTGNIPADDYGPQRIGYVLGDDDGKCTLYPNERRAFEVGWCAINGSESWASNPFVWVITFRRVEAAARAA